MFFLACMFYGSKKYFMLDDLYVDCSDMIISLTSTRGFLSTKVPLEKFGGSSLETMVGNYKYHALITLNI